MAPQRFNAGYLIRCLNLLEGARFGLQHRAHGAKVQTHAHRVALRGEITGLAKQLHALGCNLSAASLLPLLEMLFDDSKPLEFVALDARVHDFRTVLAVELDGMVFHKRELSVIEGGAAGIG